MKRLWLYLVGIILVAAAAIGIFLATRSTKSQDETISNQTNATADEEQGPAKKACGVFSLADAKKLLGDTAKGGETNNTTSSDDLAVTTCTYTQDTGNNAPVSGSKSATLLVRGPKTDRGESSNQNQFGPLKPTSVQDVGGYGDKAYWDPQYGQLNVLKNATWYILSYGPITPTDRTLQQTEQLANILINKM